ncbi:unnamed protein product [Acanthoscelides obtectus]|uniref:Uncharacterized protein n=1 Tax=Acanthoscelides obtectus TaxID=200917 RepID=A0A9P0NYL4_ACAOB|nr:unnamed protein product [Acanthoscelides obtectus]CAK1623862.1 hypothetical protein AOBTE_LOCUS2221 [Acanthoscelides obtectus]
MEIKQHGSFSKYIFSTKITSACARTNFRSTYSTRLLADPKRHF